jgi:hypothetical protein
MGCLQPITPDGLLGQMNVTTHSLNRAAIVNYTAAVRSRFRA